MWRLEREGVTSCYVKYGTIETAPLGKLSSGHRTGKGVFIPIPKKSNAKECSNYCTIALISHASKIMLQFLQARLVKHLPAMWETWVRFLGWEFPLKKEMATHSSTLTWKIPWKEETDRLQSIGLQRVGHDWATSLHFTSSCFSCTWTENFQMYKLDLGNTQKAEIKLQTYTGW